MGKAPPSAKRERIKEIVPDLVKYTHELIYGEIWERGGLSKRDRSLITIAALVASYRPDQLNSHIDRGLKNGVTREEIAEIITHCAFYCGWPSAMTGAQVAADVYEGKMSPR